MSNNRQHVAVLGASNKPQRYAYMAQALLLQHGHTVHAISHRQLELPDIRVYRAITEVIENIDTLTLYVNPSLLEQHVESILQKNPSRIIVNPGTESNALEALFRDNGITVERACTLVMLRTGQFDF